jgi:hypothetical protein
VRTPDRGVRRLSALHHGVVQGPVRAFGDLPCRAGQASDRAGKSCRQRAPRGVPLCTRAESGPARAPGVRIPRPASAVSCSTITTPHESALDERDGRMIIKSIITLTKQDIKPSFSPVSSVSDEAGAPSISAEMILAGLAAFEDYSDSPKQVLVEQVLQRALLAKTHQ